MQTLFSSPSLCRASLETLYSPKQMAHPHRPYVPIKIFKQRAPKKHQIPNFSATATLIQDFFFSFFFFPFQQKQNGYWNMEKITSLGAIKDDKVTVFSGRAPGLELVRATMTKQSPEGTALTLPLYHPVAVDAIFNS